MLRVVGIANTSVRVQLSKFAMRKLQILVPLVNKVTETSLTPAESEMVADMRAARVLKDRVLKDRVVSMSAPTIENQNLVRYHRQTELRCHLKRLILIKKKTQT